MDYLCLLKWPYQKGSLSKLQPCQQNHQGHDDTVFGGTFQPLREVLLRKFHSSGIVCQLLICLLMSFDFLSTVHSSIPPFCVPDCPVLSIRKEVRQFHGEGRHCACKMMAPLSKPQWVVRILCSRRAELPLPVEEMLGYDIIPLALLLTY